MSDIFDNIIKQFEPIFKAIWNNFIFPILKFLFNLDPLFKVILVLFLLIIAIFLLVWLIKNKDEIKFGVFY